MSHITTEIKIRSDLVDVITAIFAAEQLSGIEGIATLFHAAITAGRDFAKGDPTVNADEELRLVFEQMLMGNPINKAGH